MDMSLIFVNMVVLGSYVLRLTGFKKRFLTNRDCWLHKKELF